MTDHHDSGMIKKWHVLYVVQTVGVNLNAASGPALLIRQIIEGLREAGHHVTLLYLDGRNVMASDKFGETRTVELGLSGSKPFKLLESIIRRLQTELHLPYFGFFESFRLNDAARKILPKYDLCHEYHTLFGVGATLACQGSDIPRLMTIDADLLLERAVIGQPLRGLQAIVAKRAARKSFKTAQKLICVSEAARTHFIKEWQIEPAKIAVIPNGVDIDKFSLTGEPTPEPQFRQVDNKEVVMFVGGFQPWHGLDLLLKAFAIVLERLPQARLILVGDGPTRPNIEKIINSQGLNESVIITGFVNHQEIPLWLKKADVAVAPFPSLPAEMWFSPLKLYEYMAAGKAIVASRAGQIADVIQDQQNGLLVEPGDIPQLAQAIIELLVDSDKRQKLGENAHRQAVSQHSWKTYTDRLEKIYATI